MSIEWGEEGRFHSSAGWARSPLLHADLHLAAPPWRLVPAWGVMLAVITVGGVAGMRAHWLPVLLTALLADAIWGAWWRLATTPPPPRAAPPLRLPYAHPQGPWARARDLFPPGTASTLMFSVALIALATPLLPSAALEFSVAALALAVFAWWLRHVSPRALPWVEPVYMLGLPFLAGAALFGGMTPQVGLLPLALVLGQWGLQGTRWRRGMWAALSLVTWTAALVGRAPDIVVGATLAVLVISFLGEEGPTTATDVAWLAALLAQGIHP